MHLFFFTQDRKTYYIFLKTGDQSYEELNENISGSNIYMPYFSLSDYLKCSTHITEFC